MTKVDMRNETASNHSKQTHMGVLGDVTKTQKKQSILFSHANLVKVKLLPEPIHGPVLR